MTSQVDVWKRGALILLGLVQGTVALIVMAAGIGWFRRQQERREAADSGA